MAPRWRLFYCRSAPPADRYNHANATSTVASHSDEKGTAQSSIEAVNSSSYPTLGGTEEMGGKLSQDDVIRRLFAPASNLPEPRNEKAIVVVSTGTERALTHSQIENLLAHGIEQLKERGVKEGDKVVFYCENCPEFSSTILACWSLNAMAALIDYDSPVVIDVLLSKISHIVAVIAQTYAAIPTL